MEKVGIRELRADLSRWVRRVRDGEEIVITDRGMPVARIVPEDADRTYERLVREGVLIPPKRPWTGPVELEPFEGLEGVSLSDLVIEGRGPY